MPPPGLQDALRGTKKLGSLKACNHPDAGERCSEKIIGAHTVSRRASLLKLAESGHVYHFQYDLPQRYAGGGRLKVKRIGAGKATVFHGFCTRHDAETFGPIDLPSPGVSERAIFLHGYRAFSHEFHAKVSQATNQQTMLDLAGRGMPAEAQPLAHQHARAYFIGVETAISRCREQKVVWDRMLATADHSQLGYRVFRLDGRPDVMCSGMFTLDVDFLGRRIQPVDLDGANHTATLSVVADGEAGILAMVSWLNGNGAGERFAESLDKVPDARLPAAFVRLVFVMLENHAFRISWWDALQPGQRKLVERWANSGVPFGERPLDALTDNGEELVSWRLRQRLSSENALSLG